MSVFEKVQELGKMRKKNLNELKIQLETKQIDLENEKDELMKAVTNQRMYILEVDESSRKDEVLKLTTLEKMYADKNMVFRDNIETIKAIDQIFKIREEKKTSVLSRICGVSGIFIAAGGLGLAYGSDTFGTMINKKTMDAAKMAISRFIHKA